VNKSSVTNVLGMGCYSPGTDPDLARHWPRHVTTYMLVPSGASPLFFSFFFSFRFLYLELPIVQVSPYFWRVPVPLLTEFVTWVFMVLD
jgi:hypothetical protein